MDYLDLRGKEAHGESFIKPFHQNPEWDAFWIAYDGLLEIATFRQSSYLSTTQYEIVERMFDVSLIALRDKTSDLIEKRKITNELS